MLSGRSLSRKRRKISMDHSARFDAAIARFDEANARDPQGEALLYAQRMTDCLNRFAPNASQPLRLAARSQHICRWEIPRTSFPAGRIGYLQWRKRLYEFHAQKAGQILRDVGYDDATIARVRSLLRKENLKGDPEMQTLEDVICLVFLEHYFSEFAAKHDEAQVINILRRTWKKVSPRGRAAAMQLNLPAKDRALIEKALTQPPAERISGETEES
jgi:hypothetical protein